MSGDLGTSHKGMTVMGKWRVGQCVVVVAAFLTVLSGCGGGGDPSSVGHVIGHGRTYAGTTFTAMLTQTPDCQLTVTIHEGSRRGAHILCYSVYARPERPQVECLGGVLVIHMPLAAEVTRVRLTLSNRHSVTSPVITVPRNLGGPRSLYYQAVRGPSPIPVAITELSANGQVLGTSPVVRRIPECTPQIVERVPGSTRGIAVVRAPGRQTLTFSSYANRVFGRVRSAIKVRLTGVHTTVVGSGPLRYAPPLHWMASRVCDSHPFTVTYGVLESPSDIPVVRVGRNTHVMNHVMLPPATGWTGVFIYAVTRRTPADVAVETPGGEVIVSEEVRRALGGTDCG